MAKRKRATESDGEARKPQTSPESAWVAGDDTDYETDSDAGSSLGEGTETCLPTECGGNHKIALEGVIAANEQLEEQDESSTKNFGVEDDTAPIVTPLTTADVAEILGMFPSSRLSPSAYTGISPLLSRVINIVAKDVQQHTVPKYLPASTEEMQRKIISLRQLLAKKDGDLKTLQQEKDSLASELGMCKTAVEGLQFRNETLTRDKAKLEIYNLNLQELNHENRGKIQKLEAELIEQKKEATENLRQAESLHKKAILKADKEVQRLKELRLDEEGRIEHLLQIKQDLSEQVTIKNNTIAHWKSAAHRSEKDHSETKILRDRYLSDYITQLEKVEELEEECNRQKEIVEHTEQQLLDRQPLVDVGVAVRLRFLEQSRETIHNPPRDVIDRGMIKEGNMAAHRANSLQDFALFQCNLIPPENFSDMRYAFEDLYDTVPPHYPTHTPRMQRVMDCEATFKVHKRPVNQPAAMAERIEYEDVKEWLIEVHTLDGDEFECSDVVKTQLERLERLTDRIVEAERSQRGRR